MQENEYCYSVYSSSLIDQDIYVELHVVVVVLVVIVVTV